MRIMWQLAQATLAAIAGYVACVFLFKRKAGMVLLHIGVIGLMLNEILVTTAHKEHRLIVSEGESTSEVLDIRFHEMAIVDVSDPEVDRIVTVPAAKLASLKKISSPELPFDIQCIDYFRNSTFNSSESVPDNPATSGIGLELAVKELPPVAGTGSSEEADVPAAYVSLLDKQTGDTLGVHTLSSQLKVKFADRVTVGDKEFRILLRAETHYRPYEVKLVDAIREDYPGSTTPKYYGSEVEINNLATDEETKQRIFMNNPLRYGGETFYQSGMPDPAGGPQFSIFQVVTNVGWMIPYVCCMFTVVGLLGQFVQSLLAHLNKQFEVFDRKHVPTAELAHETPVEQSKDDNKLALPEANPKPGSSFVLRWLPALLRWLPALIIVGLFGMWAAMQFGKASKKITHNEMRLDLLGQVPVTFEGRVQPLDSHARNTLLQLRHRESVTDGKGDSKPAIAWLADGMFGVEAFDDYRTFYMTDPNVKNTLDLPTPTTVNLKRKKYVYTVNEVMSRGEELRAMLPDREEVPQEKWTPLQRQLELLRRSTMKLKSAQLVFGPPTDQESAVQYLLDIQNPDQIPFVVASNDAKKPWTSMAQATGPAWIKSIAGEAKTCLLYTSPSPRDQRGSRMPSSA